MGKKVKYAHLWYKIRKVRLQFLRFLKPMRYFCLMFTGVGENLKLQIDFSRFFSKNVILNI